ncbi:MAG: hypothetical protein WC445_00860 [Patescibacteria group bacterium]
MAEATKIVPVPAGTLTDEDYEEMIVAAMPSPVETQVAPTLVVTEPEKPAEPKKRRVCSKCGHHDGNSVGRIRRGRLAEKWDKERGIRVYYVDWFCQPCLDRESELLELECDPRPVGKGGYLIALCGLRNKEEAERYAARTARERYQVAKATWLAILAGEKPFLENVERETGCCEFGGCDTEVDAEVFAVVNGQLRRFCRLHAETLREIKVKGRNKDPRLMAWRGPEAEAKCQRHLAWLRHQAKEAERRATPASPEFVDRLKGVFDRRSNDERKADRSEASRTAKERQAAYAAALRNGGSLADVVSVSEETVETRDDGSDPVWAEIVAHNHAVDARCAGKRKKGGGKKDGKDKGGKNKRR